MLRIKETLVLNQLVILTTFLLPVRTVGLGTSGREGAKRSWGSDLFRWHICTWKETSV